MGRKVARLGLVVALGALGSMALGLDWRIQRDLVNGVAQMEECLRDGRYSKAEAYAQMILLKDRVRVHIGSMTGIDALTGASLWESAAQTWSEALSGTVAFTQTSSRNADVHVRFVPRVWVNATRVAGSAAWRRGVLDWGSGFYSYQVAASIEIATERPDGSPASTEAITQALLHEIGHVLGLNDSPRVGDVMGPLRYESPATRPAEAEVWSLLELRAQTANLLSQAQHQSMVAKAPFDR